MGRSFKKIDGKKTKLCRFTGTGCTNGHNCAFAHDIAELRLHPQAVDSGALALLTPLLSLTASVASDCLRMSPDVERVHRMSELSTDAGLSESRSDTWQDSPTASAPAWMSGGRAAPPGVFDRVAPATRPDVYGLGIQCGTPLSNGPVTDGDFYQHELDPHLPHGATGVGSIMAMAISLHLDLARNERSISAPRQDTMPMKVAQEMMPMKVPFPQTFMQ